MLQLKMIRYELLNPNPFTDVEYIPELYMSVECDDDQTTYFQNLIGILLWIVDLEQIDIAFEVSALSKFLALLHTGHLLQALHIFKYLNKNKDNDLAFDTMYHNAEINDVVKKIIQKMHNLYLYAQ